MIVPLLIIGDILKVNSFLIPSNISIELIPPPTECLV